MAKEYVPIFFDWLETTQDLSAEEKGNLIDAVVSYAAGLEYEQFLTGSCRIAFRFLKGQVDRNAKISEIRSNAGSSKGNQSEANGNKDEQNEAKRFIPPTLEQVRRYCVVVRKNAVDFVRFFEYYNAKNWEMGGTKMTDWKAAVRYWETNENWDDL